MIRKNLLLSKIVRVKASSQQLFESYMSKFQPKLETCPICGCKGSCHIHDYYGRNVVDFRNGEKIHMNLCVMRVFCEQCGHAHAILPDIIIPYSIYSLLFVLRILGQYFSERYTIEQICETYGICRSQFYKWLVLWKQHKRDWFEYLHTAETSDSTFWNQIVCSTSYSSFSENYILLTTHSFLQSHKNPVPVRTENRECHQFTFEPDIYIF